MKVVCLHNKSDIELFLRRNVYLHIYSIGDLDDFFWHKTQWYASVEDGEVQAIVSLYTVPPFPILLALSEKQEPMKDLLKSILYMLPGRFYAHLSPGLSMVFEKSFKIKSHGEHYKMGLENKSLVHDVDCSHVIPLDKSNLEHIQNLSFMEMERKVFLTLLLMFWEM